MHRPDAAFRTGRARPIGYGHLVAEAPYEPTQTEPQAARQKRRKQALLRQGGRAEVLLGVHTEQGFDVIVRRVSKGTADRGGRRIEYEDVRDRKHSIQR